jgi:hypothetical protein
MPKFVFMPQSGDSPVVSLAGDAMNLFLNENWKNVATEIQPLLEVKIGQLFKEFSNKIYHKFTLDQLLPP